MHIRIDFHLIVLSILIGKIILNLLMKFFEFKLFQIPIMWVKLYRIDSRAIQPQKIDRMNRSIKIYEYITYERILGILRVGIVVTNWPHNSVPIPKNRHHIH